MPQIQLSAEVITGLAGVIVSLLFSYFPVLREKFAAMSAEAKSGIMLGVLAVVTGAVTALNFYGVLDAGIDFVPGWEWRVVWVFVVAVIGNQAAYKISPQTPEVKQAKALREYDDLAEMYEHTGER
jgi:hypothetical protein